MYNLYSPDLGHDDPPSSVRSGDAVCGAGGRGDLHNAAGKIIKLNGATEQQPSVQQNSPFRHFNIFICLNALNA